MDNTEGTPEPGDSVETAREVPIVPIPSGKEQLQQDYDTAGGIAKLAKKYGITAGKTRKILVEAGVEIKKRGWNAYNVTPARIEGLRRRWANPEARDKQSEAIRKAWSDDPARVQQQIDRMRKSWADSDFREPRLEKLVSRNRDPASIAEVKRQWDSPARRGQQRQTWLENTSYNPIRAGEFPLTEVILHNALKQACVSFVTNAIMLGDLFMVDALIRQRPLVIEVDGNSHRNSIADAKRDNMLIAAGYEVIRFSNQQVKEDADKCIKFS